MEEKPKKKNGGARPGAGRKRVVDEKKANYLFTKALKEHFKNEDDDGAKVQFIKDVLMDSQRGQLFIAEHVFGKPKETIENINRNFDAGVLSKEEVKIIDDILNGEY